MIYIANKKARIENIKKKYPNAYIMDLTSKAREPYLQFSPFYPHGRIPVPFSKNVFSESVEGIWQGLKVFESEGIDRSKFEITNMKGLKRTVRTKGPIVGHQKGLISKTILSYLDARLEIYTPAYKYVLEHYLVEYLSKLEAAHKERDLVFLDYNTNAIINSPQPLSHAFLVKSYLEGKYPDRDNYLELDKINIQTMSKKPKNKKATNQINEQTTLL